MDDVLLSMNLLQAFNVRLYNDYARILVADWCHEAATSIKRTYTDKCKQNNRLEKLLIFDLYCLGQHLQSNLDHF